MLPQTYGPMLVLGLFQKGLEPAGQSVCVSAVAPCCISSLCTAKKQTYELRHRHSFIDQWLLVPLVLFQENFIYPQWVFCHVSFFVFYCFAMLNKMTFGSVQHQ